MYKSYKLVDGGRHSAKKVKQRPKTGAYNQGQESHFDVVRTLAFKDHFNTTKGNEFV